ncbi:(deoxy)nucleoside triphosphate pyrophosphohydrolase [Jiangella anatolica]|uniref:8-oxo-dGTP diphosphatase n=1 Tax=Jiangella anatolica TaxID=2670374 RepID=A0A2W2CMR3_9ACTN|nr:(deoxy)nucleoside triphosphate pyrophosphohydrolase [Jiangella anatolica]PZF86496.1 DNA mismatch repair protein MutT [Jiangella anatolica]
MSEQQTTPERLVVAAAIVDDLVRPARLLAARRSEPPELAGGWEFPGGKVEPGERPLAALHRELREELGIAVEVGPEVPGPYDGRWALGAGLSMRLWLAVVKEGVPAPLEDHDELRWLGPGEWAGVPWLPADVAVVEALLERCPSARA